MEGDMGRKGSNKPPPGRGQYRAGFSIPVGLPSLGRGRRVKKSRCAKFKGHINLEIPVLVRSLKSSNVELSYYLMGDCSSVV